MLRCADDDFIVLGIMNPLAMISVEIVIAAEKLLSRPEITERVVGIAAIFAGTIMTIHWATHIKT
ncbi:MAG: hypothetical protein ABI707_05320 [Ferruginibacter sp.]